jgi:precorrin-3B methylase
LNPCSRRRDWQFGRACDILVQRQRPDTPVGIVQQAYRPSQHIVRTTLARLAATGVDMFTTIIVGNSSTQQRGDALWTPRGYRVEAAAP